MFFVSDWPHREPETLKCVRNGLTSECLSADLVAKTGDGASIFAKLYSIVWQKDGGHPTMITTWQIFAIFEDHEDGYTIAEAFPATGYTIAVTDCKAD